MALPPKVVMVQGEGEAAEKPDFQAAAPHPSAPPGYSLLIRSWIRSRSSLAKTLLSSIFASPRGEVVSTFSFRLISPTPLAAKCSQKSTRSRNRLDSRLKVRADDSVQPSRGHVLENPVQ